MKNQIKTIKFLKIATIVNFVLLLLTMFFLGALYNGHFNEKTHNYYTSNSLVERTYRLDERIKALEQNKEN